MSSPRAVKWTAHRRDIKSRGIVKTTPLSSKAIAAESRLVGEVGQKMSSGDAERSGAPYNRSPELQALR